MLKINYTGLLSVLLGPPLEMKMRLANIKWLIDTHRTLLTMTQYRKFHAFANAARTHRRSCLLWWLLAAYCAALTEIYNETKH